MGVSLLLLVPLVLAAAAAAEAEADAEALADRVVLVAARSELAQPLKASAETARIQIPVPIRRRKFITVNHFLEIFYPCDCGQGS